MADALTGRRGSPFSPGKIVFTLWAIAAAVIFIKTILKPGSQTVFPIFYTAGGRWLRGENLYSGINDYLYSPLIAAFFAPLSLVPMSLANIAWRVLNLAMYLGAAGLWLRHGISRIPRARHAIVFLLMLPLSIGSLNNGQSNPLLIALVMFALVAARDERWALAALCVGLATFLKVYPLALGLVLALLFPRKFAWRLAVALLALGALSFILQRPSYVLEQYHNWVAARGVDERHGSLANPPRDFHMLLRVFGIVMEMKFYLVVQMLAGAAVAAVCFFGQLKGWAKDRLFTAVLTLVVCWMLLFGPATESSTYILLAPVISLAAVEAFGRPFPRWMRALAVTALAILIGGGAYIAFGGSHKDIYSLSIQQTGTIIFCVFALAWIFKPSLWSASERRQNFAVKPPQKTRPSAGNPFASS